MSYSPFMGGGRVLTFTAPPLTLEELFLCLKLTRQSKSLGNKGTGPSDHSNRWEGVGKKDERQFGQSGQGISNKRMTRKH
jgi:hypothetical protein